jgi:hypothetical protein
LAEQLLFRQHHFAAFVLPNSGVCIHNIQKLPQEVASKSNFSWNLTKCKLPAYPDYYLPLRYNVQWHALIL